MNKVFDMYNIKIIDDMYDQEATQVLLNNCTWNISLGK